MTCMWCGNDATHEWLEDDGGNGQTLRCCDDCLEADEPP